VPILPWRDASESVKAELTEAETPVRFTPALSFSLPYLPRTCRVTLRMCESNC
jgi:hypothetical protein